MWYARARAHPWLKGGNSVKPDYCVVLETAFDAGSCARHTPARMMATPSHSMGPSGSPSTIIAMKRPAGSSAEAITVERPAGRCGDPSPKSSTGHVRPKNPAITAKGKMPWKTIPEMS